MITQVDLSTAQEFIFSIDLSVVNFVESFLAVVLAPSVHYSAAASLVFVVGWQAFKRLCRAKF